jgi:hypothetical protein
MYQLKFSQIADEDIYDFGNNRGKCLYLKN